MYKRIILAVDLGDPTQRPDAARVDDGVDASQCVGRRGDGRKRIDSRIVEV